jgi:GT2 family glycosyltransferase/glycosyltransferase involved in cell wall biosynthesis
VDSDISADLTKLDWVGRFPQRAPAPAIWSGHVPFAFWLVNQIRPRRIVELGVFSGTSYCAFCEEVVRSGLSTSCFGIDTWAGDDHAGHYRDDVLAELRAHHDPRYGEFSTLLRMDFDNAVGQFEDGSIDLLHIDGFHTYDAVRHDFETWLPKLSSSAVVLFHDIAVRANEFGVWRFWREVQDKYPGFAFDHSFGLGVLAVGAQAPLKLAALLNENGSERDEMREQFSAFGKRIADRIDIDAGVFEDWRPPGGEALRPVEDPEPEPPPEMELAETPAPDPLPERKSARRGFNPFRSIRARLDSVFRARSTPPVSPPLSPEVETLALPFFDAQWYASTYPECAEGDDTPLQYYLRIGAARGHQPSPLFDSAWYRATYPDVAASAINPLLHFIQFGAKEMRQPHPLFDTAWYLARNPDVAESGWNPFLHYIENGAKEGRDPNPDFNAAYYLSEHAEAAANPLRHYVMTGQAQGFSTQWTWKVDDYLPAPPAMLRPAVTEIDIIIPVYKGRAETLRCIASVLADTTRPPGRIIVVDDHSPDHDLSAALVTLQQQQKIILLRNELNCGFVASVNRGIRHAGSADVVLLNSDTEVPNGWLTRLAWHAAANPRIGTITPFSNNATICSYPPKSSAFLPGTHSLARLDEACRSANAGRSVNIPTAVGFCMYIRRECLDSVGPFDEEAFGRGYGEENDFCLRATEAGWKHILACDVFVYHRGEVSFGHHSREREDGLAALVQKYPYYMQTIQRFIAQKRTQAAQFCITAALFRLSTQPVVLILQHHFGGGTNQHAADVIDSLYNVANIFVIKPVLDEFELSAPAIPEHPALRFAGSDFAAIARILQSGNLSRVHIHHTLGFPPSLRTFLDTLGVKFDFTVHDYFSICPQVNLLPVADGPYCGEPEPGVCDSCIAARPQYGARNIIEWRRNMAWLLEEADRVICPSHDVRRRIARHAPAARCIVVPHERNAASQWFVEPPELRDDEPLRIAILGNVAGHKGRAKLLACAALADPALFEFIIIGEADPPLPAGSQVLQTGCYHPMELRGWLLRVKPHVVWFPGRWPETYSYTLSEAMTARLPVIAPDIGAFSERLEGRPWSWIIDPECRVGALLPVLTSVRQALRLRISPQPAGPREVIRTSYPDCYLDGLRHMTPLGPLRDLRQAGRLFLMVLPEMLDAEQISPRAYIRLILPTDDLAAAENFAYSMVTQEIALKRVADILICQRHAVASLAQAEALIAHCRATGMRLVYDLDDDLLTVPPAHAEASKLRSRTPIVRRLLAAADQVWVSTDALRRRLSGLRADALVLENALDMRLWNALQVPRPRPAPLRILYMGTATHDAELELLVPVARRLHVQFGDGLRFDILGVTPRAMLPDGFTRVVPPAIADASYPGFVSWISHSPAWDIALAPLVENSCNAANSAIKLLDYAALGLPVIASDTGPYRALGMPGVRLVANDEQAWYGALLETLIQDDAQRSATAAASRSALLERHTLAARRGLRLRALQALGNAAESPPNAAVGSSQSAYPG